MTQIGWGIEETEHYLGPNNIKILAKAVETHWKMDKVKEVSIPVL